MLQHGDPRASIGYVTLGLFSSSVLRELFSIVDTQGQLVQSNAIRAAIDSLRDLENPGSAKGVSTRPRFRSYEAVVTLLDVLESSESSFQRPSEVVGLLEKLLSTSSDEERLQATETAILFFRQLCRRASANSQVPQQDVPAGVRQLARQAIA